MPDKPYPELRVQPGTYAAEWLLDDRRLAGEVELEPNKPVIAHFFGAIEDLDYSKGVGFPRDRHIQSLVGKLRSGPEIVLTDVALSTWWPDRTMGVARYGVVGVLIADRRDQRFPKIQLQVTAADLLFGVGPIKSISWPSNPPRHLEGQYSVETDPDSSLEWFDEHSGTRLSVGYDAQLDLATRHAFHLRFAPVITFAVDDPLTVDEWMQTWVRPLLSLATLSTGTPQRLSWLQVHTISSADPEEQRHDQEATVYGGGIDQAPYEARYLDEWRTGEIRPLFTLANLSGNLATYLRRWREFEGARNPFVELYRSVLRQGDLPGRARFLHLVQALEALDGHEHEAIEKQDQANFTTRRQQVIEGVDAAGLQGEARFLKDEWSKRKQVPLEHRLRRLKTSLPEQVGARIEMASNRSLEKQNGELAAASSLEAKLSVIRNHLSHGSRTYSAEELQPWLEIVETLSQAHALRLVGFDPQALANAFVHRVEQ